MIEARQEQLCLDAETPLSLRVICPRCDRLLSVIVLDEGEELREGEKWAYVAQRSHDATCPGRS